MLIVFNYVSLYPEDLRVELTFSARELVIFSMWANGLSNIGLSFAIFVFNNIVNLISVFVYLCFFPINCTSSIYHELT